MRNDEQEGRLEVRRNLIFYLTVRNRDDGSVIGEVGDITENGVLIISEKPIPLEENIHIAVEPPKGPDYPDRMLNLDVDVQWSKRDENNQEIVLSGCRITRCGKEDVKLIRKLIENIGFSNGQRKILFSGSSPNFSEPT